MSIELRDASGYSGVADCLVAPKGEEELCAILRAASAAGTPVTVAGSWTGLAGGCVGNGGIVISMEHFTKLEISEHCALAGAAVILRDLQAAARNSQQFYAPDPTENTASMGGMIATNASGSRSFFWKATRRHVNAVRVAFADGSIRTFRRGEAIDFEVPEIPRPATTKHSVAFPLKPGMDWVDLFVGAEGTLGIVTEAEVNLYPIHDRSTLLAVLFFETEESAWQAVDMWRGTLGLRMMEYLDHGSLELMDTQPGGAQAALMIEAELISHIEDDAWDNRMGWKGLLAEDSWVASSASERERFRVFRHALPERINDTVNRHGFMKLASDCAVPPARNQEMMRFYRERLDAGFPGQYAVFGHIGDAHVHVNILPKTQEQFDRGKDLMIEFARKAVSMNGTVSAEHGLGKRKSHLLAIQYTPEQIEAMKAVKRRLDPQWLLGRGTLFAL